MKIPKLKAPSKVLNIRKYERFDLKAFQNDIKTIPFDNMKEVSKDVNELWEMCKTFVLDIIEKHAPMIQIRVKWNRLPYVTSELRKMIRQRDYLRGKANKTGSRILRQAYNQVKDAVSQTLYKLRKSYYANKIEQHKDDLKSTWKVLKQAIGHTRKSIQIEKIDDGTKVIATNAEIAETCNMHFLSIGEKTSREISPSEMSHTGHIPITTARFQFHGIAVNHVKVLIQKLVNGTSTDIHNIPNKALKDSVDFIAPALTTTFSLSIHSKVYPDDLKLGKVTPVHKGGGGGGGCVTKMNYRSITVLPTIACVFEKIIYQQLYKHMTDNNLLGKISMVLDLSTQLQLPSVKP